MNKFKVYLLLQGLVFLIPLNVYMWGDWLILNAQWVLFRFQQSEYGDSLILGYKDPAYIAAGLTTGIFNIAAALFWTAGTFFLMAAFAVTVYALIHDEGGFIRTASCLLFAGGVLFLLSALCRFNGGFAIPVGVPVIFLLGWFMFREKFNLPDEEGPGAAALSGQ